MKTAAAAAFGDIPKLFVVEFVVFVTGVRGVNDGESTLRKRLALCMLLVICSVSKKSSRFTSHFAGWVLQHRGCKDILLNL